MIRESLRPPLQQLREIIKDEPRLRTIFESVYVEEL